MKDSTVACLVLLLISSNEFADSRMKGLPSSGSGKLPSKCELYTGTLCAKYVQNVSIFVQPLKPQIQVEARIRVAFRVLPDFLSVKCKRYAYQALCLYSFPPCDQTVNYPKPRQFCQEECRALEEHICANEFNAGRTYLASFVPSCAKLPSVGSTEHKKCVRLNIKVVRPVFKLTLKNVTAVVGQTVVLKCRIKHTKIDPTIIWYKDGNIIQPGHPFYKVHLFRLSSRVKIRRIKSRDSGKFKCEVTNVAGNISSESWITVRHSVKLNATVPAETENTNRCGFLKENSVCGKYLKNQKVYFNGLQQYESERLLLKSLKTSRFSAQCSESATVAMCYHLFPVCNKQDMKQRLCKEDCLKVKTEICQKQVPSMFPECSKLPRITGRKGKYCSQIENPQNYRCGIYQGNNFCGKYLQNKTVYYYDIQKQYDMERMVAMSLENTFVSKECLKFGVPGLCYHLFPACDGGNRKPRLCKEECVKLKTEVCSKEVSLIKKFSKEHLKTLFPECTILPSAKNQKENYCVKLGIPNQILYDLSHTCYNDTGVDYLGTDDRSVLGNACINWNISQPHRGWPHNYCRNAGGTGTSPWCYVTKERKEYCRVPKCQAVEGKIISNGESNSLGRTIYVVIAIAAVLLIGCITVIVYWKVQNAKENLSGSPQGSAAPFAKCSSTQLNDMMQSTDIKSFIMNEKMKRGKVKFTSVMGEGSFCKVFKGELVDDEENSNMNIVIKTLSEDASVTEKDAFARETSLLCPLQHVNILGLLGVSPSEDSDFIVFEYLSETNLLQFLKLKSPQNNCNEINNPTADVLLDIAKQIASGMKYLAEFDYIHGDLAARNCFISKNELTVKISMLGIGSHKYPSDYGWLHQGNSLFPIRWMAPEALESLLLTRENDIWAFGVLLWEIFSLGLKPYHQYNNTEVTHKVRAHELLGCSQDWPYSVSSLMKDCWSVAPSMRPNFETIYDTLSHAYISVEDEVLEVKL